MKCSQRQPPCSDPSARSSTGGASTRRWPSGRQTRRSPSSQISQPSPRAWQAADKVVYSTTLTAASTAKTRLEPRFDPDAVRELKADAAGNVMIGGAKLATQAFEAGLVDEYDLFVWPVILGGGKPALSAGIRTDLELLDEHRFGNGVVRLRYQVAT